MKTRCPTCNTRYDISPEALLEADGVAHCFRCGTIFDVVAEDAVTPGVTYSAPVGSATELDGRAELSSDNDHAQQRSQVEPEHAREPETAEPVPEPDQPRTRQATLVRADAASHASDPPHIPDVVHEPPPVEPDVPLDPENHTPEPQLPDPRLSPASAALADLRPDSIQQEVAEDRLPFEVPADLAPLEPSPDVALDVVDTLYQKKSRRGFFYGLLALLLVATLGLQLAWQHRKDLLRQYPLLQPFCEYIKCFPSVIHAPGAISVLQRDIKPASNQPGWLTLSATMRNDADIAQKLPDIQLSLLDNNGAVLIRRRLTPADYLFPAPAKDKVIAPGEVLTIALDFEDPGHQASGFLIDFL